MTSLNERKPFALRKLLRNKLCGNACAENQLPGLHFRRQQIIDGFIVDFYCHATGLVVEVDGPAHRQTQEADAERDAILCSRGLIVVRVTNDEVTDSIDAVVQRILDVTTNRSEFPPSL